MTSQIGLEFLDIDLGLYNVNNLESSSLDSSCSTTSSPIFCSNPNLSYNSNLFPPDCLIVHNQLEEQFNKKNNTNHNNNKNLINFQPQAHYYNNNNNNNNNSNINYSNNNRPREHSYSFSESNTTINNNHYHHHHHHNNHSLNTSNSFITNKSSSQLLTNNNSNNNKKSSSNEIQKKLINKHLDKKVPINKQQIRIESKSHVLNSTTNQHVLTSQQSLPLLSNSYSPIILNNNINNNHSTSSSCNNNNNSNLFNFSSVSSNNLSRSSSSSPSSIDNYNHMRQFTDMAIKSQLQQSSLSHLDLLTSNKLDYIKQPLTPNSHENLIKNVTNTNTTSNSNSSNLTNVTTTLNANYDSRQPILDLFVSSSSHNNSNSNSNKFDDFSNNLNTPTESINQLDFVNTIIPSPGTLSVSSPINNPTNTITTTNISTSAIQTQKKQPLLLPKPAPLNSNHSSSTNNSGLLVKPPAAVSPQSQSVRNSQISMMIPTMTNGIISRSNSQPDLTLSNLDPNFTNDLLNSTYSSYNSNFVNIGNINHNQLQTTLTTCLDNNNNNIINNNKNRPKVIRRHPSLSYKTSMSEYNEQDETLYMENFFTNMHTLSTDNSSSLNNQPMSNTNSTDDGLFLGTDALSDFISNCGAITDLFEDLPDLEDLMSLVTFESSSSSSAALSSSVPIQHIKQTQCDLDLPDRLTSNTTITNNNYNNNSNINLLNDCINTNPLSNYYDYCNTESSIINLNETNQDNDNETAERTTRSAPPSPTPTQKKKQRPTGNTISFNKAWNKMTQDEQSKAVEYLTRIINDEMGLREQLEIIRILNTETKLKPTDTQFIIDMKIIDDDKFKRIKDVIKTYGLFLNEVQISDNSSDCSANSCPQSFQLAKRELRIKRAQQRLKLKQKKDQRQINKETKSGLFSNTEVIPLSQILPEEDIEVDILS